MVDLDQDRGGHDAPLARRLGEQLRAALVCVVVAIERSDQDRGVEDQRDGRASKTSSLASLLRSPRPEPNAPMQVSGGCSPSSGVKDGVSRALGAAASSCSSASRRSWGTAMPRSRAARRARSMRSASISTLVFCVAAIANRVAAAPAAGQRPGAARGSAPSAHSRLAWAFARRRSVRPKATRQATPRATRQAASPLRENAAIPHPDTVCADRVLPTYLRHPEVGA